MEKAYGVSAGIWKLMQDGSTLEMTLLQYGHVVSRWQGERLYTFEELQDIMLGKSYEMRGEK